MFEQTELGRRLSAALDSGDPLEIETIRSRLVELYIDNRLPAADAHQAIAMAQRSRDWATVVALTEAVVSYDGEAEPSVLLRYAQALIEEGALSGAECILTRLSTEEIGDDASQVAGLLGRVSKQRFVDYNNPEQLRRAIEHYVLASKDQEKRLWAYSNLLGLRRRAERDGVPLAAGLPRAQVVRDELAALINAVPVELRDGWTRNAEVELELFDNDIEAASAKARELAEVGIASPFEMNSLLRQLDQIWQLEDDHALRLALSDETLSMGAGAAASVPSIETSEKIFGGVLPIPIPIYERGTKAARQVCKITDRSGYPVGTGFVVPGEWLAEDLGDEQVLMTAGHVAAEAKFGPLVATFTRWPGPDHNPVTISDLEVRWSSPPGQLDAAVLRSTSGSLPGPSTSPIAETIPSAEEADPHVFVIGHPAGRDLEMSIRGNELLASNETTLQYRAPTEPGSSGSPVFDKGWSLVGVHHRGGERIAKLDEPEEFYAANEATTIEAVRDAMAQPGGD